LVNGGEKKGSFDLVYEVLGGKSRRGGRTFVAYELEKAGKGGNASGISEEGKKKSKRSHV